MLNEPMVSVIIPARNEAAYLSQTLASVQRAGERLNGRAWEVIVVDNGSTDGTWELLHDHVPALPLNPIRCELPGAARARNMGRQAARGTILVFLDADTRLPVNGLERITQHCVQHLKQGGITRLAGADGGVRSQLWWTFWEHVRRLPLAYAKAMPALMFCTAAVFDEFGPFDERVAIGEEWPILASLFRRRPQHFVYDRSLTAVTSDRRMTKQSFGYTRTLAKYVWAILHVSGRVNYSDRFR